MAGEVLPIRRGMRGGKDWGLGKCLFADGAISFDYVSWRVGVGDVQRQHLVNVGKMHFQAMFSFVDTARHAF